MVIDTSAIVAILRNEPEAVRLEKVLVADPIRLVPAACVLETRMVSGNLSLSLVFTDGQPP